MQNKSNEVKPTLNLNNVSLSSLDVNIQDKMKFLKLMGVKSVIIFLKKNFIFIQDENFKELLPSKEQNDENFQKGVMNLVDKTENMKDNLEKQFNAGMMRKDGRKVGLGYSD